MKSRVTYALAVIGCSLLSIAAMVIVVNAEEKQYTQAQKAFYLSAQETVWIRPGLKLEVLSISIPSTRKPVVTFMITDDKDQPLDRSGIFTPGSVSTSFILSYLPAGANQYVAYTTRTQTSPITGVTALQAGTDSGGSYAEVGDGTYTYTFGTSIPLSYNPSVTHTLGVYATRDLREFDLDRYVANAIEDFVPDGRPVTSVRRVVATENCNQCHNPLALHGGSRREVRLCILCHTPQTTDPDTGNTVDFKVMIHKIHMGEHLPSVEAGQPYQIIGFGQSVHDFSTVAFPQDVRNCTTCHKNAAQADNYRLNPSRAACGACHDNVDFRSGVNHFGGFQPDDSKCALCHWSEGFWEYDVSIPGAHTVPYKSTQLRRPKFEVVKVSNTGPGQKPAVEFRITDRDGTIIAPSEMTRLSLRLAGPTSDYNWYISESAINAAYDGAVATHSFSGALPSDAQGTYSVGVEGYINTALNPGTVKEFSYRDAGDNVIELFAVTGPITPRRAIVDIAKCNKCHDKLQLHGNNRNQTEYCVGCHNPTMTDAARRPDSAGAPESIHFKVLIHRIHSGEELTSDFTVYGFGGTAHNFNELRFPGDRRDCTTCHVGTSYMVPLPSQALASTTPRWYWTPILPTAAACLGCHDSVFTAAHAYINTAIFGESCAVCHKEGAAFSVSRAHAR